MVYRPAMAMSQSLDVIFPSPRIYFTVENFVLASVSAFAPDVGFG
jgi:hypothetical protein